MDDTAAVGGSRMPDANFWSEVSAHIDRRFESVFNAIEKRDESSSELKVEVEGLRVSVEALTVAVKQTQEQLQTLFHLRSYGMGLLAPLALVLSVFVIGAGEFVRRYVDTLFPHH